MTGHAKRKWRWSSKSVFASSPSSKVRILDQMAIQTQDGATDHESTNGLFLDGCSTDELSQKSGVAAKMRRNGSKLLSIVGFQKFDSRVIKDCPNAPSERDVAITIAKDAAAPPLLARSPNDDVRASVLHGRQGEAAAPHNCVTEDPLFRLSPAARIEGIHVTPLGDPEVVPKPSKSPLSHPCKAHDNTGELWKSRSNSGFTSQLSHKLSSTFGNPTVVHRPNMRTRPALLSVHEGPLPGPNVFDVQLSSPLESTTPSSYNTSGSISTGYTSTAKTSLDSNITSMRSPNSFKVNEGGTDIENLALSEDIFPEKPLTPIPERLPVPVVVQPTVITVETTANTKIFLETHFNALLAGHASPRSIRRHGLVSRLETQSTNEEQRRREISKWAACESEHLRQIRVLKTKANAMNPGSGAASAGYEVIRVLGKGSFGVVRLVREKDYNLFDTTNAQSTSSTNTNEKHTTREDLVSLKATAIEALKASLDSQRMGLGRTNMKAGKEVYAMKVIRKSDMLRNCQEGHLRAERDFLVASESSSWVVPLIASFEDSINLYLVMEYMVGGDFLGLLFRKDILKERHARWYIAEMVLCVEEAHKLRWIHRDVKPDNFLISASGHLKISDFGLAFDGHWAHDQRYFKDHRQSLMDKLGITVKGDSQDQEEDAQKNVQGKMADILNERKGRHHESQVDGPGEHEPILQWRNRHGRRKLAGSVVGTSQYMAPEVVRGDPYDGRCDWWSIGIILYECLYGFTPFVCEKREDTKAKILDNAKTLVFPDEKEVDRREKVSYDAMELINSLLQEKEHRLSSKKYLMNDYQHSRRSPGQLVGKRADLFAQDYQGNYVYPDDANDIKAHHFFRRISWDRLHLTRPPFVPDVNGCDDTKYFDDEEPISDVNDAESQSHISEPSAKDTMDGVNEAMDVTQVDGAQGEGARHHDPATACCVNGRSENRVEIARPGAKKRPRDKVLRDKALGRTALELRKKGAFLGYAYRRPNISL